MNSSEVETGNSLSRGAALRSRGKGTWWLAGALIFLAQGAFASDVCSVPDTKAPLDIACSMPTKDNADTAKGYESALTLIQKQLAKALDWKGVLNPVTESQVAASGKFASLRFLDDNQKEVVRFYINLRDLYVVGYKVGATYYELKDQTGPDLQPKVKLSFGGSYQQLETKEVDRTDINYGWVVLTSSLNKLALDPSGGREGKGARKALLVVIPMLIEGSRFKYSIGRDIQQNIVKEGEGRPVQSYNIDLMESWRKLSDLAFSSYAPKKGEKVTPVTIAPNTSEAKTFKDYKDVSGSLGILLTLKK
ncbi:MAG: ribosome-inactivating family protein [Pseudomonas sp.]|uniref:ribosome-inactivating family protein n=1 Tax=Pseudomonas sp. TaxID=306 RepID=UPI003D0CA0D6